MDQLIVAVDRALVGTWDNAGVGKAASKALTPNLTEDCQAVSLGTQGPKAHPATRSGVNCLVFLAATAFSPRYIYIQLGAWVIAQLACLE